MARALALILLAALAGCEDPQGSVPTVKQTIRAQNLVTSGKYEEALKAYVALWQAHVSGTSGARGALAANDFGELVNRYPPAKARFTQLRDALAPGAKPDPAQLDDWLALNEPLGETSKSLAWFDQTAPDLRADPKYAPVLERRVITLLIGADRWADAGKLYRDPVASLRDREAVAKAAKLSWLTRVLAGDIEGDLFRDYAAKLVRALHAAGRADDVAKVSAEARKLDPSPQMGQQLDAALKPAKT